MRATLVDHQFTLPECIHDIMIIKGDLSVDGLLSLQFFLLSKHLRSLFAEHFEDFGNASTLYDFADSRFALVMYSNDQCENGHLRLGSKFILYNMKSPCHFGGLNSKLILGYL